MDVTNLQLNFCRKRNGKRTNTQSLYNDFNFKMYYYVTYIFQVQVEGCARNYSFIGLYRLHKKKLKRRQDNHTHINL